MALLNLSTKSYIVLPLTQRILFEILHYMFRPQRAIFRSYDLRIQLLNCNVYIYIYVQRAIFRCYDLRIQLLNRNVYIYIHVHVLLM
jgi:hypothetical protein